MMGIKSCAREAMNLKPLLPHLSMWTSQCGGPHQPVNTYYWHSPHGLVVIDPFVDAPVMPDVVAVFITHVHAENVVGAGRFNAPIHAPAGDAYLCEGPARYSGVITKWAEPWDWTQRGNYRGHLAGARPFHPCKDLACFVRHCLVVARWVVGRIARSGNGRNSSESEAS